MIEIHIERKKSMKKPLVWGHRGASGYAPENTLPSFQLAADMKADGIELDIQLTKDDQIVVIHDEWLDRTSDGKGFVKDYTLEELRRFNFNKTIEGYAHCDIPLMSEVFELIEPTDLTINIELKTSIFDYEGIEEKILEMTRKYNMENRVIYSSFNHHSILRLQKLNPSAPTAFLCQDGPIGFAAYAKQFGVDAIHPWFVNLRFENFMQEARREGLAVNTWTVNEPEYIRMCTQFGVNAVITNYPDVAQRVIQEVLDNA